MLQSPGSDKAVLNCIIRSLDDMKAFICLQCLWWDRKKKKLPGCYRGMLIMLLLITIEMTVNKCGVVMVNRTV